MLENAECDLGRPDEADPDATRTTLFIKRSMGGAGYAGVENELFFRDQTMMLLSDAKKMVEEIVKALD